MMRKIFMGTVVLAVFILLNGCDSGQKLINDPNMQVNLIGTDSFPRQLVGRWRSDRFGWEIEFAKNGAISSIVHPLGNIEVSEGHETSVPLIFNGKGVVRPGKWIVEYDKTTRNLTVEINLDSFVFQKLEDVVEGKSKDIFSGPISGDGTQWEAFWQTYPEYIITTDIYNKKVLPIDDEQHDAGVLIFQKIGR